MRGQLLVPTGAGRTSLLPPVLASNLIQASLEVLERQAERPRQLLTLRRPWAVADSGVDIPTEDVS